MKTVTKEDFDKAKIEWNKKVGDSRVRVIDDGFKPTGWTKVYASENDHQFYEVNTIETRKVNVEGVDCFVKILSTEFWSDIDSTSKKFYSSWS